MRIIILEDNKDREVAMRASIADKFPGFGVEVFAAVKPFIDRITASGLYDVALISLDHDLDMIETGSGQLADPGTGVDAAEWLASQPAVSPVIIHTTNNGGGTQMVECLSEAGWVTHRVVPYGDMEWIAESWRPMMRDLIVAGAPSGSLSSFGVQVINSAFRNRREVEWQLNELLKLAVAYIGRGQELSLELGYSNLAGNWCEIAGSGMSVLRESFGGTRFELMETISNAQPESGGPVLIEASGIAVETAKTLQRHGIQVLQTLKIELPGKRQAVLFVASQDSDTFASHMTQAVLRELSNLITLVLLNESGRETRTQLQDALTRFPR